MKMLIVQDTDWIRRNPIQHTHLTERLVQKGHKVVAIDYEILWKEEGKKELLSKLQTFHVSRIMEDACVTVIRPGILKIPFLDYASMLLTYGHEIKRQIEEFKPDVIVGNDILTPLLAYRAGRKRGIPTIFYAIDIEHKLVPSRFLQPLARLIESKNIKDANLVISINEGLRDYTIKMGARPEKTMVIRAGIDVGRFNPSIDGGTVREKHGIRPDDKVLFFMGWLYNFSGLQEVALELAKLNDRSVKFMLVGEGDAYDELCAIRDRYGMQDQIILTGKLPYDALPGYIAAADICLLPAHNNEIMRDIVPIKMYEYLALGKPIISTRLPGVMKEFGDGNGVVYVDRPEDAVKMAVEMLQTGCARAEGQNAWRFVEKNDWDHITTVFENVIHNLLKNKASGI